MGLNSNEINGELFLFMTYKRGSDAVFLQFDGGGIARMRIKSAGGWHNADSGPLRWKKGDHHHMAGTWGGDGLKLYLDGELEGESNFKRGLPCSRQPLRLTTLLRPIRIFQRIAS